MAHEAVHHVAIAGTDTCFEVVEGERILGAALRAGVWIPFECGWGSCGTCKMTLVDGEAQTLFTGAPAISPRDARRNRILACQSTAKSDLVVKPTWVEAAARDGLATQRYPAVLTERREIGPAIFRLVFTLDSPASFHEGQHAVLELGDGLRRCYSMSNRPGSTEVEFVMKRYAGHEGSEAVSALARGSGIYLEMPYGDMWIRDGDHPVCLVAGGTGIAPILGMLRGLAAAGADRPVRVVYGANIHDELVCWQDLAVLIEQLPDAELVGALTTAHAGWNGVEGLVTHALEPRLPDLAEAEFYIAGPPVMTNSVTAQLTAAGIQLNRIRYDSFG
ncbi:2Fe-2S iron-sulfur cluster-binding protein [Mycobacterium sp. shizuoka-1]|uniref:2Fe-2S iron-sulfur cluster-binding protein n=1 Tax=Mycobacterium sp. shizuoka-1 TaxID=2039281 RepID=UPI000C064FDA|nr:2Fe-2S iron-sulfur cluster-binding protein [Mycobacterium sp. shizuoka-1]GAY18049.1 toluate 1,2-dioxygenase electron transfer subunit [Mycobacterium sp. shizuoka-1]